MEKMILIPEEQYYKMLESYDAAMEKLYEIRKFVERFEKESKQSNIKK